jgi:tetratricopeptide (TPR) repeat protein
LERLVTEDPENPTVLYWLGRVVRKLGEWERSETLVREAYDLFNRVLRMDPDNPDAFHMSTWCLLQLGAFDEAAEALSQWTREKRDDAKTWELYGYLYSARLSSGKHNPYFDLERAFQAFDRSLAENKNNTALLQKLIRDCNSLGREEDRDKYNRLLRTLDERGWQ